MCDIVKIRIRMGMGEEARILWMKENGSRRREIIDVDLFFPNKFGRKKRWVQKVSSSWKPCWHIGSVVLHNFSFKKDWNFFFKIGNVNSKHPTLTFSHKSMADSSMYDKNHYNIVK